MQAQTGDTSDDKRGARRNRVLKGARIVFNGGFSSLDCTIRNTSPGGAMLQFPSTSGIPNTFELIVAGGEQHTCTVVWRSEVALGVTFQVF